MSFCKSCKYWKLDAQHPGLGLGHCTRAKMLWDNTQWDDDYTARKFSDRNHAGMFVQDGSDYHASLFTLPTFGCTEFVEGNDNAG